jgi:serine/threonine-protein phosphatase 6 regulatory subunit 3
MSILNRSPEFNHLYDSEGRLQGGLHALEELARVIAIGSGEERDRDTMAEGNDETEPALELPVSNASRNSPSLIDSDEDMSSDDDDDPGSSDDDAMEEIAMYDDSNTSKHHSVSPLPQPPAVVPLSPATSLPSPSEIAARGAVQRSNSFQSSDSDSLRTKTRSHSRRSSKRTTTIDGSRESLLAVGEKLKKRFLDVNVLSTLLVNDQFPPLLLFC